MAIFTDRIVVDTLSDIELGSRAVRVLAEQGDEYQALKMIDQIGRNATLLAVMLRDRMAEDAYANHSK